MATKQVKCCDVFGTTKDVATYKVQVVRVMGEGSSVVETTVLDCDAVDLSPRAFERLTKKITQGMAPPSKRGDAATPAEEGGDSDEG